VAAGVVFIQLPDRIAKQSWRVVVRNAVIQFDLVGLVLFAPAMIQFFLALQYGGNQFAWDSSQIIGLFCGSGVNLIVWLAWDYYQGDDAMVPFSMMRKRVVWVSCLAASFLGSTIFVMAYYLPIYFQVVRDARPFMSGVDVLPNIIAQLIFGIVAGVLSKWMESLGLCLEQVLKQRVNSREDWLLHAFPADWGGLECHRLRPHRPGVPPHSHWSVGGLPDHLWSWTWSCIVGCG
jgi:hypothetical protein